MSATRFILLVVLIFPVIAFEAPAQPRIGPAGPRPGPDADEMKARSFYDEKRPLTLEEKAVVLESISRIPEGDLSKLETRRILLDAGKIGGDQVVRQLERIVLDDRIFLTARRDAMTSLWRIGVNRQFFLGLSRSEDQHLQALAIWILAIEPEEEIYSQIRKQRPEAETVLGDAISDYHWAYSIKLRSNAAESIPEKMKVLLEGVKLGWRLSYQDYLHPASIWSRSELARLSQMHPDEVAAALTGLVRDKNYRTLFRDFLGMDCVARLDQLEKEKEKGKKSSQ